MEAFMNNQNEIRFSDIPLDDFSDPIKLLNAIKKNKAEKRDKSDEHSSCQTLSIYDASKMYDISVQELRDAVEQKILPVCEYVPFFSYNDLDMFSKRKGKETTANFGRTEQPFRN